MVYKARLLLSGRQKIALAILIGIAIAFLANYPRVTEAILAFLLGGVVPGTNIVVSPDVVLLVVAGVFIFGTISLVIRMYFKAAHSKRNFRIAVQAIENEVVLPVTRDTVISTDMTEPKAGVNVGIAVRKRSAVSMFTATSRRRAGHGIVIAWGALSRAAAAAASACGHGSKIAAGWIWKGLRLVAEALYTLVVLLWYGIEAIAKFLYRASIALAKHMYRILRGMAVGLTRTARHIWGWAHPVLKRLDAWLEMQVRRVEARARKQLSTHKTTRTVGAMGKEYRKSVHELHPRAVLRSANQKAGSIKTKLITAHKP